MEIAFTANKKLFAYKYGVNILQFRNAEMYSRNIRLICAKWQGFHQNTSDLLEISNSR